jgi:site-specific recombinase XerD
MTVEQVRAAWLAGYASANTRAAYEADLRSYLTWCAEHHLEPLRPGADSLDHFREARQSGGISAATVARQFAALRAFYTAAERLGACVDSPFEERQLRTSPGSTTPVMSASEVKRLLTAATADPRLAVLVHLLLGEGLRLSEALAIDHDDISGPPQSKRVNVVRHGRRRHIPLSRSTSKAVSRLQRGARRGGPLLVADSHTSTPERLSRFGADFLLKQAAQSAGIDVAVSANVLRRTHAARAHESGEHIDDIRDRMGHRDVRTTRRYIASDPPPSKRSK